MGRGGDGHGGGGLTTRRTIHKCTHIKLSRWQLAILR